MDVADITEAQLPQLAPSCASSPAWIRTWSGFPRHGRASRPARREAHRALVSAALGSFESWGFKKRL